MSGPKKTAYQIRQEEYQRRKELQADKRDMQIDEIESQISLCQKMTNTLLKEYGSMATTTKNRVDEWIDEIDKTGDLRYCFKALRGIESFIEKQKPLLKSRKKKQDIKREALEKEAEKKREHEAKIARVVSYLTSIEKEYKDILNDGIKQRVTLFKNAMRTNPDNQNTLKQIKSFKTNLHNTYEEHLEKVENTHYIADVLSEALGAKIQKSATGLLIDGSIDSVPISVKLNHNNNSLDLDTPMDGSCRRGLDALIKKLDRANIDLGAIKVVKTGQTINHAQTLKNIKVKA